MSQPSRHSVSVAAVVVNDEGQVLVIQRRDNGHWQIPGGVLELGESIEDGLRREVLEETGIEVDLVRLTGVYKNMRAGVLALVFLANQVGGVITTTDEAQAVQWWSEPAVLRGMTEAFAIRVQDALSVVSQIPVRHHDGTFLL